MTTSAHNTSLSKHTKNECFYLLVFTGKEKDSPSTCPKSEGLFGSRLTSPQDLLTRYYNFGARCYDSDLSGLFLSVDPMADKYPSLSPYAYCAWNPVKLVDPNGMDGVVIVDTHKKTITVEADIIFYANSSHVSGTDVNTAAKMYKNNIVNNWCKDKNGNCWTAEYNGESYNVSFNINVSVDNTAKYERNRDYDGKKNYIGIDYVVPGNRNEVSNSNNGLWKYTSSADNSGGHEFGHLLGLKDRYTDGKGAHIGWENNIMSKVQSKPDQRNIDAIINRNGKNMIDEAKYSDNYGLFRSCSGQRIIKYYLGLENKE